MPESPSLLVTIFAFILVLGPLVVVHELGHYLVGRWFGVKADAFSVGFGKELIGRTDKRGTRWKISAIPLGGYVQFAGDWNELSMPSGELDKLPVQERSHTFHVKPLWQRALIVAAGPVTNLIFALAIFSAFNLIYGKPVASNVIAEFSESSTAHDAGLAIGDRIVAVDGAPIEEFGDLRELVSPYPNRTIVVTFERDGRRMELPLKIAEEKVEDEFGNEARIGRIGVVSGKVEIIPLGPIDAVSYAGQQTMSIVRMMVTGIGQILSGERSVRELGGPVKIAKYSGEQFSLGWSAFVYFAALISINLAFINFLPIPGLDGGHLAFYAAEAVRRKPLGHRSQEWAFRMGLAFVLALTLFVTINDVITLPFLAR